MKTLLFKIEDPAGGAYFIYSDGTLMGFPDGSIIAVAEPIKDPDVRKSLRLDPLPKEWITPFARVA